MMRTLVIVKGVLGGVVFLIAAISLLALVPRSALGIVFGAPPIANGLHAVWKGETSLSGRHGPTRSYRGAKARLIGLGWIALGLLVALADSLVTLAKRGIAPPATTPRTDPAPRPATPLRP